MFKIQFFNFYKNFHIKLNFKKDFTIYSKYTRYTKTKYTKWHHTKIFLLHYL